ncbi:hypothetical protein BDV34DRAFT_222604 [Aspergillus parasiticus]|uniref:HNH nuclease domain-containing protein n=1 Tax=Aspergillus parasiticus TaxID=5067 RepID=A0A5N6DTK3_ASPPA|nr:hypothetical protein BDV34DRAFT_222604 [Aspergillus parasiticus]
MSEAVPARSLMRNILIEFSSTPGRTQGGLCGSEDLTVVQFLDMLHVVNQLIPHGLYLLTPNERGAKITTSDEPYYPRTLSVPNQAEKKTFRDQVRQRDGRCVITGQINVEAHVGMWTRFEAAHIFSLALHTIFHSHGFLNLITYNHPLGITSPQNGILLRSDIHQLWDDYSIAVNPNDGYRIQSFTPETWEYHGKVLDPVCRQPGNPLRIVDGLLQWQYEQAVLCNMRRDGGPSFEFDFPLGTDMMREIREGPAPAERMEAELFGRLYGVQNELDVPGRSTEQGGGNT